MLATLSLSRTMNSLPQIAPELSRLNVLVVDEDEEVAAHLLHGLVALERQDRALDDDAVHRVLGSDEAPVGVQQRGDGSCVHVVANGHRNGAQWLLG